MSSSEYAYCIPFPPEYTVALLNPNSPKKLPPQPSPAWAFEFVCCFLCLLFFAPLPCGGGGDRQRMSLHGTTTATREAAPVWGGGVGSKTKVILCASPSEDQQTGQNAKAQYSKNKVYVGFLIPACCTRNAGRPSPL